MNAGIRQVGQSLQRLVFPHVCILCTERPPASPVGSAVCADCLAALPRPPEPSCQLCGGPRDTALESCRECLDHPRPWRRGFSALSYQGPAREEVQRFKYAGRIILAGFFAQLMLERLQAAEVGDDYDCIVPVPMHWWRYVQRGFNQTDMIAERLGQALGLPVRHALRRSKAARRQSTLTRAERLKNLSRAFQPRRRVDLGAQRVLLLDDVLTTGATLTACSKQLASLKPASIDIITVARG